MRYQALIPITFLLLLLMACQSNSGTKTPSTNEPVKVLSGKEAYDMYCVACHGADGKMMFSGATDLSTSSLDLPTRITQIKNGKGVMNAFKGILTDEEIENVAIYIEGLRE